MGEVGQTRAGLSGRRRLHRLNSALRRCRRGYRTSFTTFGQPDCSLLPCSKRSCLNSSSSADLASNLILQLWLVHPHPPPTPAPLTLVPSTSKLPAAPAKPVDTGPTVEYLATLKQHTGVVNVVRFCPVGESSFWNL